MRWIETAGRGAVDSIELLQRLTGLSSVPRPTSSTVRTSLAMSAVDRGFYAAWPDDWPEIVGLLTFRLGLARRPR